MSLETETSAVMQGQPFRARGLIDNTRGSTEIKGFKIVIAECIKRIADWGHVQTFNSNNYTVYEINMEIPIGTSLPFDVELKVPIEVLGYTAIGNIIYRGYVIML